MYYKKISKSVNVSVITYAFFYRSERITQQIGNFQHYYLPVWHTCWGRGRHGNVSRLFHVVLFWSAPVIVFRCFICCCLLEGKQIFISLLQSHKVERLKDEQKKASSLSSLNGCLLMCLEPFWLLPSFLDGLERNHIARSRVCSHQMMRNTLLFYFLGPNQSPARAGLESQVITWTHLPALVWGQEEVWQVQGFPTLHACECMCIGDDILWRLLPFPGVTIWLLKLWDDPAWIKM